MTNFHKDLDYLFEQARQETPVASFEETSKRFSSNLATVTSIGAAKGFSMLQIFSFSLSSIAIISVAWFLYSPPAEQTTLQANEQLSPLTISKTAETTNQPLPAKVHKLPELESQKVGRKNAPKATTVIEEKDSPLLEAPPVFILNSGQPDLISTSISENQLTELPAPKISKDSTVRFTVDESTPTGDLAYISSMARKAGIDYTYVVDQKRKLIKEFNVDLFIKGTNDTTSIQVCVPKKGKFEIVFGWTLNDKGKAIKLCDDIRIQQDQPRHLLH